MRKLSIPVICLAALLTAACQNDPERATSDDVVVKESTGGVTKGDYLISEENAETLQQEASKQSSTKTKQSSTKTKQSSTKTKQAATKTKQAATKTKNMSTAELYRQVIGLLTWEKGAYIGMLSYWENGPTDATGLVNDNYEANPISEWDPEVCLFGYLDQQRKGVHAESTYVGTGREVWQYLLPLDETPTIQYIEGKPNASWTTTNPAILEKERELRDSRRVPKLFGGLSDQEVVYLKLELDFFSPTYYQANYQTFDRNGVSIAWRTWRFRKIPTAPC